MEVEIDRQSEGGHEHEGGSASGADIDMSLGDRKIELVMIGVNMKPELVEMILDSALLTPEEELRYFREQRVGRLRGYGSRSLGASGSTSGSGQFRYEMQASYAPMMEQVEARLRAMGSGLLIQHVNNQLRGKLGMPPMPVVGAGAEATAAVGSTNEKHSHPHQHQHQHAHQHVHREPQD